MSQLNILHLSDLHFRSAEDHDVQIVLSALNASVEQFLNDDNSIDLVIFSGDLVQSGASADLFDKAATSFITPVLVASGVGPDRFLICPGNHDIDRDEVRNNIFVESGLTATLKSREQINAFIDQYWTAAIATPPIAFARLSNFYAKQWAQAQPCKTFANLFVAIHEYQIKDHRIGVALFNTAWRTTGEPNDLDRNRLILGERAVDHALATLRDADIKIAVFHHPLNWLTDEDEAAVDPRLQAGFDLLLCGHVHRNAPQYRKSTSGEAVLSQGAALYVSRKYFDGFNIIGLDTNTDTAIFRLFEYSDERREFTPALRIAEDGQFSFPLGGKRDHSTLTLAGALRRSKSSIRQQANKHLSLVGMPSGNQDIETHFVCPPFHSVSRPLSPLDNTTGMDRPKETLKEILLSTKNVAFVGRSEHGKTSLAHYIAVQIAEGSGDAVRLPIICQFGAIKKHAHLLWQLVRNRLTELSDGTIQRSFAEREPLFVVVDDVDLNDGARLELLEKLISDYKNVRWCLLVRSPAGALSLIKTTAMRFAGFDVFEIKELDRKSIRALSACWVGDAEQGNSDTTHQIIMEQIQRTGLPRSGYIVSLMLWAMLNRSRGELINEAVLLQNLIDFMLGRMDYAGALRREFDFQSKSVVLQALAFWFKTTDEIHTKNEVVGQVIQFLQRKGLNYDATQIVDGFILCGVFTQIGDTVSFRYRRFQEFFVAGYLGDNPRTKGDILNTPDWIKYARELDLYTARFRHEGDLLAFAKRQLDAIKVPEPTLSAEETENYLSANRDPTFVTQQLSQMRKEPLTANQIDTILDSADRQLEERRSRGEIKNDKLTNQPGTVERFFITLELYSELLRNLEFVDREEKKEHLSYCLSFWDKGLRGVLSSFKDVLGGLQRDLASNTANNENEALIKAITYFEETVAFAWPAALSDIAYQNIGSEKLIELLDDVSQETGLAVLRRLFSLFILLELDPSRAIKRFAEISAEPNTDRWAKNAIVLRLFAYYRTHPLSVTVRSQFETLVADLELQLRPVTGKGKVKGQIISEIQKLAYKDGEHQ